MTAARNRTDDAPLPDAADVVVIGAGAIGLAIAYELSLRGVDVAVLERDQLDAGTSSGNAGFVVPSHVLPVTEPGMLATAVRGMVVGAGPVTVRVSLRFAYLRWLARFLGNCRASAVEAAAPVLAELGNLSATLFKEWLRAESIDCCYVPNGLLNVYGAERAFASGRQRAEWEAKFGVPTRIMTGAQAREREPALNESVVGAVFYPQDAGLDPGRFVDGLAAALRRRGVLVASATPVFPLRPRSGKGWRLRTPRGELRAGEVVLAAGAWTPHLAAECGIRIPVQPAKGYSLTVRMPSAEVRQRMLLGEKHVAVAPMGDRLRLSGWFELGRYDRALRPARLAHVEANVRDRLRLSDPLEPLERWAGLRPVAPDGLPLIGRASLDNLSVACGHAMLGITLAPATARLMAQTLCGQSPDINMAPFSPTRFL